MSDITHMNPNKGNSEGNKKTQSSLDQMFSFRSNAQLWAVTTGWSLLGRSKRPSTLRLQPCSNKENKQQLNRQTRTRRNTTLNPNILSGSFVFAHGNALNILISGAQICQNTFPVAFKNSTADRSHFRTAANFLSLFTHKINVPKRLPPMPEPFKHPGILLLIFCQECHFHFTERTGALRGIYIRRMEKNIFLLRKL